MQLDKAIQDRRSVKNFSKKKPNWRDILECINSARYAPMAGNNFTLKFILVEDSEKIKKLVEASQQDFFSNVNYVVVAYSDPSRPFNLYGEKAHIYCCQQAGAGIQNFLLSLEQKGLTTCWVGHFVEYLVKETLGIPEDMKVEALFPIGFEDKNKPKKIPKKIELERFISFDKHGRDKMKDNKVVKDSA